jgi:hypothetical protein
VTRALGIPAKVSFKDPTYERNRQKAKGGRMSLRAISAELATQGFLNENGRPFAAASIRSMLD